MSLRTAAATCGNYSLDDALLRLPYSNHSHTQAAKEEPAVKSQRPKYGFVVLLALKCIPRVTKDNVIPIYVVCKHAKNILLRSGKKMPRLQPEGGSAGTAEMRLTCQILLKQVWGFIS